MGRALETGRNLGRLPDEHRVQPARSSHPALLVEKIGGALQTVRLVLARRESPIEEKLRVGVVLVSGDENAVVAGADGIGEIIRLPEAVLPGRSRVDRVLEEVAVSYTHLRAHETPE